MSQEFGNHFVRKPAQPGEAATTGLPSRPVILPPKRVAPIPEPAPEPVVEAEAAPVAPVEPKPIQVKAGPIRVEIKKPAPVAAAAPAPVAPAPSGPKRAIKRLETKPTYTKVFRWQLPEGQTAPQSIEIAGTFNNWQKAPLEHDGATDTWLVNITNIAGHRPHHYMLFVNGQPAQDKNAEGLAIPQTPEEQAVALTTPRGPRVFLLAAQAH